jgi:hypothetical protein
VKKTCLYLGLLAVCSVCPSEVRMVKNHIYNWTGTKLRVRCSKIMADKQPVIERFELPSSGSNTINIFPDTSGYVEITDSFFCDERMSENTVLTDSQIKNQNIYQQFRIIYSWLKSSNILTLKMQKAHEDDILQKVPVVDLPSAEPSNSQKTDSGSVPNARFFATLLSAEGALESCFYFRREQDEA